MAAYSSELQFLANAVTTHVHSAEQHNQDINSLALISARKTEEALDILKLMLASYLSALCQAIDLRQLEQILVKAVSGVISSVSDACHLPESIKEELINVARGIPVYTYLESPCNPSLPLVSALKQTFLDSILAFHDLQIVVRIPPQATTRRGVNSNQAVIRTAHSHFHAGRLLWQNINPRV